MATAATDRITIPDLGTDIVRTPFDGDGLPLFIQPATIALGTRQDAFQAWLGRNIAALDALVLQHGAIVLRGFPIHDTAAFSRLLDHVETANFDYAAGATPRAAIAGKVFEATRAPAEAVLGMHQEMAYLPHYPARLAFYCRAPAATGGETFIADMRRYTAALPSAFRNRLEERGVLYTRNFRAPDVSMGHPVLDAFHKTWTDAFSTTSADDALRQATEMGLEGRWLADGSLSLAYRASGFIRHPATGETLSFNQIPTQSMTRRNLGDRHALYERHYGTTRALPYHTTYGDGSAIDEADLDALYAILDRLIVAFPWSAGDVMILDNFLTAHGRNAYTGVRDVQVALLR